MRVCVVASLRLVAVLFLGLSCASAAVLLPTDDGMAGRDWYSGSYRWVDDTSATVNTTHSGENRWLYRGIVIFDISTLWGSTLAPGDVTFDFYSFGMSSVQLQYANASGPTITTAYADASGPAIAALDFGEGQHSYDVSSFLQGSIDSRTQYVSFIFNTVVANGGGGSIAAVEDAGGRGSYLQVGAVPEPSSLILLGIGLGGVVAIRRKRTV